MKKLLLLLLLLPMAFAFSSCSNDDDLPNVKITMDFGNAVIDDGVIYIAQSDTLILNNIETKAIDSNKSAVLANVKYYWNYVATPYLTWSPLPLKIPVADMPLSSSGHNILGMKATLLEVDKSMAYTSINVPIRVVASEDDLPDGQIPGDVQLVLQVGQSRTETNGE